MIMAFGGWPSMGDAADWDLQAVVRGFFSPPAVDPAPVDDAMASLLEDDDVHAGVGTEEGMDFPDLGTSTSAAMHELEGLCQPFFVAPLPAPAPAPAPVRPQRTSQIARSKRRKSQVKREVCQVPADGLAADKWAWRKYGQKPIKGSPYPRGYYRCSTSKACPAKKQVERSCSDPSMFVITYAAEHNHPAPTHRNSLAGSTRQKYTAPSATSAGAQQVAASPSANTSVEEEEGEESSHLGKQEEEEDGEVGEEAAMIKDEEEEVFLSDDMFMELGGGSPGGVLDSWFSDSSPIDFSDHWFAAAAAAGES